MTILTKICEKHKSTSPSGIQEKNQLQAICIEEKLDAKAKLKEVNELLTYAAMVDSHVVAYVHCVIMWISYRKCQMLGNIKC